MYLVNQAVLRGNVTGDVRLRRVADDRTVANFGLAVNERWRDRGTGLFVDGRTSFFHVSTWGTLAENVALSVAKGEAVLVVGRVNVVEWEREGRHGIRAEVNADLVAHDLSKGVTAFRRRARVLPVEGDVARLAAAIEPGATASAAEGDEPAYDPVTGEILEQPVDARDGRVA